MKHTSFRSRVPAFVFIAVSFLSACSHAGRKEQKPAATPPGAVADEVSLKADRSQFDDLRKEIPEETRRENDEVAAILNMMGNGTEEPSKVRDRFSKAIRDRREKTDKDLRKKREVFTAAERKSRDEFLKNLQKERDRFSKEKHDGDERKEFFAKQDEKRKEFFADQADKRKEFESQVTEQRKTFEDYIRETTNKFNQEHRDYTSRFNERRKAESLKKQMEDKSREQARRAMQGRPGGAAPVSAGGSDSLDEFKNIPKTPAMPLGPSEE